MFSKKIFIIDDEPFNILGLKNILKLCFDKIGLPSCSIDDVVDIAYNGKDALDKIKQETRRGRSYALLFMDCQMPFMDGYETCWRVRDHYV